jgi:hypothetical protein
MLTIIQAPVLSILHSKIRAWMCGGLLEFEGRINRSKIARLTGKGFKIGITATKSDWSVLLGMHQTTVHWLFSWTLAIDPKQAHI